MSESKTCTFCFSRDREIIIEPAIKRRMGELVQETVKRVRELPGAGMDGDDSGLNDVFEEWADQVAYERSPFYDHYEGLVWQVCSGVLDDLDRFQVDVLSAFTKDFDEYSTTEEFTEKPSDDDFFHRQALLNELFDKAVSYANNWATNRRIG